MIFNFCLVYDFIFVQSCYRFLNLITYIQILTFTNVVCVVSVSLVSHLLPLSFCLLFTSSSMWLTFLKLSSPPLLYLPFSVFGATISPVSYFTATTETRTRCVRSDLETTAASL